MAPIIWDEEKKNKNQPNWYMGADTSGKLPEDNINKNVVWKDNVAHFAWAKVAWVNLPTWEAWNGWVFGYTFSAGTMEEIFLTYHINHDYKVGTDVFPHVHWVPSSTDTWVVRWWFEWTCARGHSQEPFSATSTVYIEQASTWTINMHQIAESLVGITLPNAEPDMLVNVRVFRDATHVNDTYTDKAFAFMADLHYQANVEWTPNKAPNFYI